MNIFSKYTQVIKSLLYATAVINSSGNFDQNQSISTTYKCAHYNLDLSINFISIKLHILSKLPLHCSNDNLLSQGMQTVKYNKNKIP